MRFLLALLATAAAIVGDEVPASYLVVNLRIENGPGGASAAVTQLEKDIATVGSIREVLQNQVAALSAEAGVASMLQIPNAVVRLSGQSAGLDTSEIEAHLKAVAEDQVAKEIAKST